MPNFNNIYNGAVNRLEDLLTPRSVIAQRTFIRPQQPVIQPQPTPKPVFKFTRPTTPKQVQMGQNNATNSATQPKGTVFGSNLQGTPQSRALKLKSK